MPLRKTSPLTTALRARVVSYALGAYKRILWNGCRISLEGTHWIGNQNF